MWRNDHEEAMTANRMVVYLAACRIGHPVGGDDLYLMDEPAWTLFQRQLVAAALAYADKHPCEDTYLPRFTCPLCDGSPQTQVGYRPMGLRRHLELIAPIDWCPAMRAVQYLANRAGGR